MEFRGKVAVITGGTSGIGFAVAKKLAEMGAKVVIVGRNEAKGLKALARLKQIHEDIQLISCDVTDGEQVKRMMERTVHDFGRLDFAFNNAANDEVTFAYTADFSEQDYDHLMDSTLKSVWLCMKYELQVMSEQRNGVIVNTSSVDALLCSAGTAVYSAGKSGVIALTKSIAQEYGPLGIRVNALSPGAIRTPLLEKKFLGVPEDEAIRSEQRYKELNALGRIGTADEAASVVVWLFSNQSSYVTGQNIVADGGISLV
ncbi:SDR family NAD(P)-dependent oxidoreductase [Neobacillus sp. Marseille-QA0830]